MPEKRRITVVIGINDFIVGGAQRLILNQLPHWNRDAFDIHIVTLFEFPGKATLYDELPTDVPVHRLRFRSFWDAREWMRLYRLMSSLAPEVVVSNLFFSNTVFRLLSLVCPYRTIICEHNTYFDKTRLQRFIDRVLACRSYRIVAVSDTVASFTAAQEGIAAKKFVVITNGIDIERIRSAIAPYDKSALKKEYGFAPERKLMVNVARLTEQKDQKLLLDGFAGFAAENPSYDLSIVGEGALRHALEQQAQRLGVGGRVHFMGNRSEVLPFYCMSEFFVSTSQMEGFGIAHAEALACGIPVLSTRTAGPDILIKDGENGYFIPEATPKAVSMMLARMARSNLADMGKRGQLLIERYDIKNTVRKYEGLIREAVSTKS